MAGAQCTTDRGESLVDNFFSAPSNGSGCTVNTSCSCIGSPRSIQTSKEFSPNTQSSSCKIRYVIAPHTRSLPSLMMAVMVHHSVTYRQPWRTLGRWQTEASSWVARGGWAKEPRCEKITRKEDWRAICVKVKAEVMNAADMWSYQRLLPSSCL